MDAALAEAANRASDRILVLGTRSSVYPNLTRQFPIVVQTPLPETAEGALFEFHRQSNA